MRMTIAPAKKRRCIKTAMPADDIKLRKKRTSARPIGSLDRSISIVRGLDFALLVFSVCSHACDHPRRGLEAWVARAGAMPVAGARGQIEPGPPADSM